MNNAEQLSAADDGRGQTTPPLLVCRHWYHLHLSTWAVAAAVSVIVAAIVVPGRVNNHGIFASGPLYYEHGWPLVFLDRAGELPLNEMPAVKAFRKPWISESWFVDGFRQEEPLWLDGSNWPLTGDYAVYKTALAVDLATAFGIVVLLAASYEWWRRTRWPYSLQYSLGVLVLVSSTLGWWWASRSDCTPELRTVVPLRDKGFDIQVRCRLPIWLHMLVGADHLPRFHHVVALYPRTTDDPDLGPPDPNGITDAELQYVKELPELHNLFLDGTRVTDRGLEQIKDLTGLKTLWLDGTQVTDAGLAHLKGLTSLRWLCLSETRVTDQGMKELQQALPNCRIEK